MSEVFPVVALSGPSGVGKGYLGNLIKRTFVTLGDIPVYTTRIPRPDEHNSTSRFFLDDSGFDDMVATGSILLDHRPFRSPETPRYGFGHQALLRPTGPNFTEIHSSLIVDFRRVVVSRPTLLIGILASEATQQAGIETRQGSFNDGVAADTRLNLSQLEIEEIRKAHGTGLIDRVVNYDPENRAASEQQIISSVQAFMEASRA